MSAEADLHAAVRAFRRDRLLDAAVGIICAQGWDRLTMAQVADAAGVSRQSVYNEVGSKRALGEAVVAREADRFLAGVSEQLHEHGSDAVAGIAAAARHALREAAGNPLLTSILSAAHGAADDLLPLLTTRPEPVLQRAVAAVLQDARTLYASLGLGDDALASLVDVVVRLTLSHLAQPVLTVDGAVDQVRWVTRCVVESAGR